MADAINLEERHKKKETDVFDHVAWNALVLDVSNLFVDVLAKAASFEEARAQLIQAALFRLTEVLQPAFEQIQQYQTGGFLIAPIVPESEVTFEEGFTTIGIHPDNRDLFSPTAYVALVRDDNPDDVALARAIDYSSETGALEVEIVSVIGDPGPHSDVRITATAGSVVTQLAAIEEMIALRDRAKDWAEKANNTDVDGGGTRSAKHHANAASTSAGNAATSAGTATSQANVATVKAGEASASAATALGHADAAAASAAAALLADPDQHILWSNLSTPANILEGDEDKVLETSAMRDVMAWGGPSGGGNLSDAATIAWNWENAYNFVATLAGNREIGNPTNVVPGETKMMLLKGNDGTNRAPTFGNAFKGEIPVITNVNSTRWYLLTIVAIATDHVCVGAVRALG